MATCSVTSPSHQVGGFLEGVVAGCEHMHRIVPRALKCFLESIRNRTDFRRAGKLFLNLRTRGRSGTCAFPPSRPTLTQKAGSKAKIVRFRMDSKNHAVNGAHDCSLARNFDGSRLFAAGAGYLIGSNADGFHSTDVENGPTLINSHLTNIQNDFFSTHSTMHLLSNEKRGARPLRTVPSAAASRT